LPTLSIDPKDRVGIYDWGVDDSQFASSGAADRLAWSSAKVAQIGAHTIRVAITPADPYGVNPAGTFDLAATAAMPAYDALFANPAFHTIVITAYSTDDQNAVWQDGYADAASKAETKAIADLGKLLLDKYPGKTFVIANWEGDNAIAPFRATAAAWSGFTAWINARADGVVAARAAAPQSTSALYSALEFNALRADDGSPCGGTNKCVVSNVAPNVRTDLYSYSSWQSTPATLDETKVGAQLSQDLDAALAFVRAARPGVDKDRFFVGELGAARQEASASYGECKAAARIIAAAQASIAWGARWAIDWQIIDNAPTAGGPEVLGFGLYKASGAKSVAGALLEQLYAGVASPSVGSGTYCPQINVGGIINGAPGTPIHVGSTVSLYGAFSGAPADTVSGYVVHVRIGNTQTDVTKGSTYWYESANQINATLAGAGMTTAKNALVWSTSAAGIDSNGQYVDITP
jgi:hypothetical protein